MLPVHSPPFYEILLLLLFLSSLFICCTSAEGPADGLVIRVDRSFLIIGARLPSRAPPFKALKAFFCESTIYKAVLDIWYI